MVVCCWHGVPSGVVVMLKTGRSFFGENWKVL